MSLSAYRRTIRETETPRQIERRIMARITTALAGHQPPHDAAGTKPERLAILATDLRAPLAENQKLWSALKADLISPGNGLPPVLRAQLVSLATFVERQTASVLAGEGKVAVLVEINRSIMAGLAGQVAEPA